MNPEYFQPMPIAPMTKKRAHTIYGDYGKPVHKSNLTNPSQSFGLTSEQKRAWKEAARTHSPFHDVEPPRRPVYTGNRWAGDPNTTNDYVTIGDYRYAGRTWVFPAVCFSAERAELLRRAKRAKRRSAR